MMTTAVEPTEDIAALPAAVRWRRALAALSRILAHPEETERVLEFTTYANAGGGQQRMAFFYGDPRSRRLYDEHRALDSHTIDLDELVKLPADTLGHAYASFMKQNGLTPDVFDGTPKHFHEPRAAYLVQRVRQSHDLWHVVTNAKTDPAGEIALQAFTFAQLRAPSAGILAALGTLRTIRYSRQILRDVRELYRLGLAADNLAVFPWEDHWATPLAEVRRLLGIPAQPRAIGGYTADLLAA
ncbi:MAG: uncharacterized protein JWO36_1057 [Myxococcales bacterium]|nr:uncharacterized protein [Myxococcales bacterium]